MGWIANVFLLAGMWFVGERRRVAFLFTIFGEILWVWKSLDAQMYDLAAICAVFGCFAAINWWKWGNE